MENLHLVRFNHLCWLPDERDALIDRALEIHMTSRCKLKIDTAQFNMLGIRTKPRKCRRLADANDKDAGSHPMADIQSDVEIGSDFDQSSSDDDTLMRIFEWSSDEEFEGFE